MKLKDKCIAGAAVFVIVMSAWFGYLKVQSYVIGVYTGLGVSQAEVRDMQRFWRAYLNTYDAMTDYQRMEMDKERLRYELKVLNALEPFVAGLEDANQIGE